MMRAQFEERTSALMMEVEELKVGGWRQGWVGAARVGGTRGIGTWRGS